MNSVERVKAICKSRKIPISRLERELGFSNGYIGQLRKGTFPADRLVEISNYLDVTTEYLLTGNDCKKIITSTNAGERDAQNMELSHEERVMIERFRRLDSRGKAAVLNVLDYEYNALPGDKASAPAKEA